MIIGITGKKYSGKDTIADYLITNYDYKRFAFADPLKDICRILFNFSEEQLYGKEKEIVDIYWNISPRNAFQKIGTDLFRNNFNEDFWIKVLERKLLDNPLQNIVISDVRFENEVEMIRKLNGKIIKVVRNNNITENIDKHESENNNIMEDILINNNETLHELYFKLDKIL